MTNILPYFLVSSTTWLKAIGAWLTQRANACKMMIVGTNRKHANLLVTLFADSLIVHDNTELTSPKPLVDSPRMPRNLPFNLVDSPLENSRDRYWDPQSHWFSSTVIAGASILRWFPQIKPTIEEERGKLSHFTHFFSQYSTPLLQYKQPMIDIGNIHTTPKKRG